MIAVLAGGALALEPTAPMREPVFFALGEVEAKARQLAEKPYENPDESVPAFLRAITKQQWDSLSFKPDHALWKNSGLPFEVGFYHPGFIYNRTVAINVVTNGGSERIPFSHEMFNPGDPALTEQIGKANLNFAGFALRYRPPGSDGEGEGEEIAIFLGASYFQSVGRHSRFGLYARALALNTALPDGEEFPYFREYWLVKPKPGDASLILYALLDSPSMVGAYRLEIVPGTSTVMNVESRLFQRQGAKLPQKIGLAPLTSMFLYSETTNGKPGDYRPEVHNSDGFLFRTGKDGWTWRPLNNPARLTVDSFPMPNPQGFGLMQRDGNFDHYQDLGARFDQRPSLWVEPRGDWGSGHLELIEIPGTEDFNTNIVAFWVPDLPDNKPASNGNAAEKKPAGAPSLALSYRLYWMTPGTCPHQLGRAMDTRMVKSPANDAVTFIIDFAGEELNALPSDTGLASAVETTEQAPLIDKQIQKNPVTGGWRLTLKFRLPQEGVVESLFSARSGPPRFRFNAFLKKGENLTEPLTETWHFDFTP